MEPIGARLVAAGLLEPAQLAWATEQQRRTGGYLGEHLVAAGMITADAFYAELARSWEAQRRDLVADPPQPALLAEIDVEQAVELGWIACELTDDGAVVVATCVRPAEDLVVEVLESFPARTIEFVACSRADLDAVALGVRLGRLAGDRRTSSRRLVQPAHVAVATVGAVAAVVAAALLPMRLLVPALVGASVVFVGCGLVQLLRGYLLLVADDRWARAAPPVGGADDDLPLYSVIVRVCGGQPGLDELFGNFRGVDYPRERTDAILVVSEDDTDTFDALRATGRRGWVRVARVPQAEFVDVVRACDHALALARGRYVVAYDQDERPAPDQLRLAVAAFEADLAARLDARLPPDPLVGLRVGRRSGPEATTALGRMAAAGEILHLDGAGTDGFARSPDVTSVHFNMRLLRRLGGFGILAPRRGPVQAGERPPRIEGLDSSSVRAAATGQRRWFRDRAEVIAEDILDAADRLRAMVLRGAAHPPEETRDVASHLGATSFHLAYPVVLGGGVAAALRSETMQGSLADAAAWVALGEVVLLVSMASAVAATLLVRRHGWRAGFGALALPALWSLQAFAAWVALYAVLLRPRAVRSRRARPGAGG